MVCGIRMVRSGYHDTDSVVARELTEVVGDDVATDELVRAVVAVIEGFDATRDEFDPVVWVVLSQSAGVGLEIRASDEPTRNRQLDSLAADELIDQLEQTNGGN